MITLESTKKGFAAWQATRFPVPLTPWEMVDLLLFTHKRSKVCKILGIRYQQIQLHCKRASAKKQTSQPSAMDDFIEARSPILCEGTAELTLKEKCKFLHLCLPASLLCEVLSVLGALL